MLTALINFLITALTIYLAAKYMRKVSIKSFGTAALVALAIAILNFLIGWLLVLLLNVATLGLFFFTGLNIIISIIANAIIIELVDKLSKGFHTEGFSPSLMLAIILAVVNGLVYWIFGF